VLETETELWLHELREDDFFSLEERDANVEGAGRITLQDLFQRGALRQRPRRIIVGEVRGAEAVDMLHAMSSGHDGSLTTLHASGVGDALYRLEALALSGGAQLGPYVIRHMLGSGIDLLIHLGTYQRDERTVRRLAGLAFVAENREDQLANPIVQQFCEYRMADDGWEWDRVYLSEMPKAIAHKFAVADLNPKVILARTMSP
jgi:pilus assembly protein CpaF